MRLDVSNNLKPFTQLTMQIKLLQEILGGPEKKKVGGGELHCLPILFDITGEFGGSTVDDLAKISGESYSNVARYVARYAKLGLITYDTVGRNDRQKYIFLTDQGEQFKRRLFTATEDQRTQNILQMQESAIWDAKIRGHDAQQIMEAATKAAETGQAQKVNYTLKADSLAMKAEVGSATVKVTPNFTIKGTKEQQAEFIRRALGFASDTFEVKHAIAEYGIARHEHVITQILRAARDENVESDKFAWRGIKFDLLKPSVSLDAEKRYGAKRLKNQGVWMLYNKNDDPDRHLPSAIQLDLEGRELAALCSDKEQILTSYEVAGLGDVTFSGVMLELNELLNEKQYQRARTMLTKAFAEFSHQLKSEQAKHEQEYRWFQERGKSNRANAEANMAHASHPLISQSERLEFTQRAHEAAGDEALNKEAAKESQQKIDDLQSRLDNMERMMAKLLAEKDDNKDG